MYQRDVHRPVMYSIDLNQHLMKHPSKVETKSWMRPTHRKMAIIVTTTSAWTSMRESQQRISTQAFLVLVNGQG